MTTDQTLGITIFLTITVVGLLTLISVYLMIGMAAQDYGNRHEQPKAQPVARPAAGVLFWRAMRRKCPICGRGDVLHGYFHMNQNCSGCGAVFWKNEGEWTGPMLIDFIFALAASLYTWAVLVYFSYSVAAQLAITGAIAAFGGIAIMPWSRSLWTMFLFVTGEIEVAPEQAK
jgi:uncharacterized protein (DUF983 family)